MAADALYTGMSRPVLQLKDSRDIRLKVFVVTCVVHFPGVFCYKPGAPQCCSSTKCERQCSLRTLAKELHCFPTNGTPVLPAAFLQRMLANCCKSLVCSFSEQASGAKTKQIPIGVEKQSLHLCHLFIFMCTLTIEGHVLKKNTQKVNVALRATSNARCPVLLL